MQVIASGFSESKKNMSQVLVSQSAEYKLIQLPKFKHGVDFFLEIIL